MVCSPDVNTSSITAEGLATWMDKYATMLRAAHDAIERHYSNPAMLYASIDQVCSHWRSLPWMILTQAGQPYIMSVRLLAPEAAFSDTYMLSCLSIAKCFSCTGIVVPDPFSCLIHASLKPSFCSESCLVHCAPCHVCMHAVQCSWVLQA